MHNMKVKIVRVERPVKTLYLVRVYLLRLIRAIIYYPWLKLNASNTSAPEQIRLKMFGNQKREGMYKKVVRYINSSTIEAA